MPRLSVDASREIYKWTSTPSESTTHLTEHNRKLYRISDTLQSLFCSLSYIPDHPQPEPRRLRKRRKLAAYRTSSLDRGRDAYYRNWTAKEANDFKPEPALLSETDSESIATLWEEVSMVGKDSLRPKTVSQSQTTTSSKKPKRPSPYDKDFGSRILDPRCIITSEEGDFFKAYTHFGVKEPTGNRFQYYTEGRGATDSTLWLEDDEEFVGKIVAEYVCMVQSSFCESEFAFYAVGTILKAEPRNVNLALKRCWRTERTIQLVAKPAVAPSSKWCPPPVIISQGTPDPCTEYEFDLRPDCAFWLSLQAFNQDYVSQLQAKVFVMKKRMTCPYLTIEFKKDDALEEAAINHVASAAALALYNRFLLREKTIGILHRRRWTEPLVKTLRHYGITWTGSEFDIWCVVPVLTSEFEWAGCTMTKLYHGDCMNTASVRELINWLNEIHCWGLTVHGPRCEKDIKLRMNARQTGIGTSDIGADSEDESSGSEIDRALGVQIELPR